MSSPPSTPKRRGRGQGELTKIKRELKTVQTVAAATELAKQEISQKIESKKPIEQKLKDFIVEKVKDIDPMEALAIAGATLLIKNGIDWTEEVVKKVQPFLDSYNQIAEGLLNVIMLGGYNILKTTYQGAAGGQQEAFKDALKQNSTGLAAEAIEWLVSFTAAFLIIRYFGQILELGSSILGLAKNILGIGAAVI